MTDSSYLRRYKRQIPTLTQTKISFFKTLVTGNSGKTAGKLKTFRATPVKLILAQLEIQIYWLKGLDYNVRQKVAAANREIAKSLINKSTNKCHNFTNKKEPCLNSGGESGESSVEVCLGASQTLTILRQKSFISLLYPRQSLFHDPDSFLLSGRIK